MLRKIDMEKIAIESFLKYDNVRIFSFFNNFDLIRNLNNYVDEVHFINNVNSQILEWIKEGAYKLT